MEGEYSSEATELYNRLLDMGMKEKDIHMNYLLDEHPNNYKTVTEKKFSLAIEEKGLSEIRKDLEDIEPDIIIFVGGNIGKHFMKATVSKTQGRLDKVTMFGVEYKGTSLYSTRYYGRDNKWDKFNSQMNFIFSADIHDDFTPTTKFEIVKNIDKFYDVIDYCKEAKTFCFDFETTGVEWYNKDQVATILSISFNHGFSYILPLYHREPIFEGIPNILKHLEENPNCSKPKVIGFQDPIFTKDEVDEMFEVMGDEIFSNRKVKKIAHNLKFDLHWMSRYGVNVYDGRFDDTMLMSHIIDENTPNGLKDLTKVYFPRFSGYEDELKLFSWESTPLEILSKYASIDTDITLRLAALFEDMLINDMLTDENEIYMLEDYARSGNPKLVEREKQRYILYLLYRNLTMPSFFALFEAEHHGAKIDAQLIKDSIKKAEILLEKKHKQLFSFKEVNAFILRKQKEENAKAIKELDAKIQKRLEAGRDESKDSFINKYKQKINDIKTGVICLYDTINFNSPTQLTSLLFDKESFNFPLQIDPRTGEGKRTSAREHLQEIDHPFIITLFAYRSISKMLSTYYQGILDKLDENGFIHSSFLLHGTKTGRLSSRNPNLQNIPSRLKFDDPETEECLKMVKKFFTVLDDSYYAVQADYSQAELRVIANFSEDDTMIDTYKKDIDIHALTASRTIDKSLEEFYNLPVKDQKKYRFGAKGTNFGLVFDISVDGYKNYLKLQYGISISRAEAQDHYTKFFKTYTKLKKWHDDYRDFANITGYVRTLFGRKRRLEHIKDNSSRNSSAKATDERLSINNPVQGTSGEYAIFSAAILRHRLPKGNIFFNTVHDSVFFYLKKDKLDYCLDIIHESCENPPVELYFGVKPGIIPMKMDIEISDKSWGDMEELDDFFNKN